MLPGAAQRRPSPALKAAAPKVDSWRYAKDRPPARVSLALEERLLGGPVGAPVASGPVSTLLRRYKGPDQDLAAALERCAIGLPLCWQRYHLP